MMKSLPDAKDGTKPMVKCNSKRDCVWVSNTSAIYFTSNFVISVQSFGGDFFDEKPDTHSCFCQIDAVLIFNCYIKSLRLQVTRM
jgi:citrate lyase synthetase